MYAVGAPSTCPKSAPWHCDPDQIVPTPSRTGDPNFVPNQGGAFRIAEKKYSSNYDQSNSSNRKERRAAKHGDSKSLDLTEVFDFANIENNTEANKLRIAEVPVSTSQRPHCKHFDVSKVKLYSIKGVDGLYVIPNPFSDAEQRYWVRRCILDFSLNNPTNISNLHELQTGQSGHVLTHWSADIMPHLRWASLGYHFQWTPRVYTEVHKGTFPQDLAELVQDAAGILGYGTMRAEAAIINYYPHTKCTMGGHLDDAEEDMSQPIVSTSFGNTVIFLIGGRTRDEVPVALYIRSGDIVMMSGESRYFFHGVPKMLPGTVPDCLKVDPSQAEVGWTTEIRDYMVNARLNMNARQVRISSTSGSSAATSTVDNTNLEYGNTAKESNVDCTDIPLNS